MSRPRRALSFENVLVTVVAFIAIAGGTAYAAGHLGKNSVGKKQLKANSVTAAKLKKNAVTAAKIKKAAISSPKVKDGTIGGSAFDPATSPFSGVVQTATSTGTGTVDEPVFAQAAPVPLTGNTFTQQAGETIFVIGRFHFDSAGKCGVGGKKLAFLGVYYDTPDPLTSTAPGHEIAEGVVFDLAGTGPAAVDLPISSFESGSIPPPASPTTRTLTAFFGGACEPGAGSISASDLTHDVVGVK